MTPPDIQPAIETADVSPAINRHFNLACIGFFGALGSSWLVMILFFFCRYLDWTRYLVYLLIFAVLIGSYVLSGQCCYRLYACWTLGRSPTEKRNYLAGLIAISLLGASWLIASLYISGWLLSRLES